MNVIEGRRAQTLDGLYCFYLICKLGSLKDTAALLGITKPSLSEKMAKLQRHTGPLLYIRNKRCTPTPQGVEVYERIKPAYEALEEYWAG